MAVSIVPPHDVVPVDPEDQDGVWLWDDIGEPGIQNMRPHLDIYHGDRNK